MVAKIKKKKMIAIALIKQQTLSADPRTNQVINFTGNVDREGSITCLKKQEKLVWTFHKEQ